MRGPKEKGRVVNQENQNELRGFSTAHCSWGVL